MSRTSPALLVEASSVGSAGLPRVLDHRYLLQSVLGSGAHGRVFRALHLGLKRPVAIKLLGPDQAGSALGAARFRQEAVALGRLRHPHVVEVSDFGLDRETGEPYLVMELLAGRTLADRLREVGPLSPLEAGGVLRAVAQALDAAHALGVLHRDVKPANVWLAAEPDGAVEVKVLDFGLAKLTEALGEAAEGAADAPGETSAGLGTPLYAAPEVLQGAPASVATDLYSLAALAYEALAGRPPFPGSLDEVIHGHLYAEPPEIQGLDRAALAVLCRGLAKSPASRPASARAFVQELETALALPAVGSPSRLRRRRRVTGALVAATLAAVALGVVPTSVPPLERALFDGTSRLLPSRLPDPRLLLVTLDEGPGAATAASLAERADEIAAGAERMLAAGARGVAFDLLPPARWAESIGLTRLLVSQPDAVTLAALSLPDASVVGPEAVGGLVSAALGPERSAALFGFVNVDEDPDGLVRRGRTSYLDRHGVPRPSWAARAATTLGASSAWPSAFWIDPRIDDDALETLSWTMALDRLAAEPSVFRGRLILLGASTVAGGDDVHRVPDRTGGSRAVTGLVLEARLVDSLLAGPPIAVDARAVAAAAAVAGGFAWLLGLGRSRRRTKVFVLLALTVVAIVVPAAGLATFSRVVPVTPALTLLWFAGLLAIRLGSWLASPPSVGAEEPP